MLKRRKKIIFTVIITMLLACLLPMNAIAASVMHLYYYNSKNNVTYTEQQVKYYFNGKAINMKHTPGIIIDGNALASFKDVFVDSAMDVTYKYLKSKGTVTLTYNKKTIVFTIGSKKAYVNGKAVTIPAAPKSVKYKDQKVTKILVPTRFVAETFGCKYTWNSASSSASITSPMKLYYNKKTVVYTGTEGKISIDGKNIKLGNMPSIIVNNTAMVRAKVVFNDSSIGAKYAYNKSTRKLTLTKGTNVVVLTMDSPTAYVNGKARKMDTSAIIVKNVNIGTFYIMVPGSFVSSYLGYDYSWNSGTKTSVISSRKPDEDNQNENDGPELGSDPIPADDIISLKWDVLTEYLDEYTRVSNLTNTTEINSGLDTTAYVDVISKESLVEGNKEKYSIHSSTPFGKSTAAVQDKILTIHLNNAMSNNTSVNLGGSFVDVISSTNNSTDLSSDITFNLLNPNLKYELTLSDDKCTLYVTLYSNYISNISTGVNAGNDFVQITGMNELSVDLIENDNYITLQIPNTFNGVGGIYEQFSTFNSLKSIQSTTISNNMINITIEKSETSEYFVTRDENTYRITLFQDQTADNSDYDMQISLPNGVDYSEVQNEDRYYNHQFAIILPGDYRDYYQNNPITTSNDVVNNISVNYNNYDQTEIIVTTKKLQGYKLVETNGAIGVVIGNPRDIYQNIVVLDAGHGGTDPGASRKLNGVTINEKDINFSIIYSRTKKYFNAEDSNIKVYYSRYNNTKVDLYKRAAFAKEVGADLFVSLHMNANNNTTVRGTEIYYSDVNNSVSELGLTSKGLASIFINKLPNAIGTTKRGIRSQAYVVVKYNTVPAILIELAFMSTKADLNLMTNSSFQENAASSIYEILCGVFEDYPTGR